jgi:hypothetical protein
VEGLESWFEELQQVNSELLAAAKKAKADKFLHRSAVEKYAEPSHFIFELLQNADDQEAKKVQFKLLSDRAEFLHWGKPFTPEDVERITRLGDSDKPNEVHKIGSFGIGFKSVFAVTERPEVYCQLDGRRFAFAIEELIVPVALPPAACQGGETVFLLPYSKRDGVDRSSEAAAQLGKTGPEVLMFLNHIEELVWEDNAGNGERYRRTHRADGITVFERTEIGVGKTKHNSTTYRLFRKSVTLPDGSPSGICLAFRLNADGNAVGENGPAKLWVYFETEEQIGFRCRVHGPFKLTDNRANIMRSESFNRQLIDELSSLAATALTKLRDEKRLVRETLNAMPIPADDIPENWTALADSIWQALRDHQVLPTAAGAYAGPASLWQGTQDFRAVLDNKDLTVLASQERSWAVSAGQRNSRIDRLLSHIGVEELTLDGLLKQLESTAQRADRLESWLADHDDAWVQSLYLLLDGIKGYQVSRISHLPVVRTAEGNHVSANKVRFAPTVDGTDRNIAVQGVSLVAPGLLAGRNQVREEVTAFLRRIKVNDVNEEDYIRALLARHYYGDGRRVTDLNAHRRHMERFAVWLAAHPYQTAVFEGASLFLAEESDELQKGGVVYIDKPFHETGLTALYGAKGPLANTKRPLAARYRGTKGVLDLARALGVTQHLHPARVSTRNHPEKSVLWADYYRYGTRWGNSTDVDWVIPDLQRLLSKPDAAVSLCLWRSLQAFDRSFFFAKFRHAESYPLREKPASFVYQLRLFPWIPRASGGFQKPEDINEGELPPEFDTTDRTGWLEVIGLGANAKRKAAEYQQQRQVVLRAGIPDEFAERFQELSEEQRRSVLEAGFRELTTSTLFPERESPNWERRANRLAERVRTAPQRSSEIRELSVRTTDLVSRQLAKPYLLGCYTNALDQMICQACRRPMPFRLPDRSPYFEAVDLLDIAVEVEENHIALCPTCSAKWHHARTTTDTEVQEAVAAAQDLEISVTLAGEEVRIGFVRVHLDDLRTIIASTVGETSETVNADAIA